MNRTVEAIDMRHSVVLEGCSPTPLAGYLKALGVLRLVAEQADPEARGYWRGETFAICSRLQRSALEEFFKETYSPTPLLAPWGARSGFYPGSSENSARVALEKIASSDTHRLTHFREMINEVKAVLERLGMEEKARDDDKLMLLRACRSSLPDDLIPWLDACYVLTADSRGFPPLLGTGGNEGSGSYVSGFAQQVVACIIERKFDEALQASLFGSRIPNSGSDQTPGQFFPSAAGGPNSTSGFSGGITLNPWDFLLCLEGTLMFAATATRRLEGVGQSLVSFPFTTRTVGSGSGSSAIADESHARAEMWLPLWRESASVVELSALFGEGRAEVRGKTAQDGLDFARSVSILGVDRGIYGFQRYGFLQRFGRNVHAIPLNRMHVQRNPNADLIDQLDSAGWLERFRRLGRGDHATHQLASLVRRLEDALFDLACHRDDASPHAQRILVCLGEIQRYLARSPSAREQCGPVPLLSEEWITTARAGDDSAELRIAIALAGLQGRRQPPAGGSQHRLPLADQLAPSRQDERRRWWVEGENRRVVWGNTDLERNLLAVLQRRLLDAAAEQLDDKPLFARATAPLGDVAAWLGGGLDTGRIAALLPGLALAQIPRLSQESRDTPRPLPAVLAVLKPFFCTDAQLRRTGLLADGETLDLPGELVRRLAAGRVDGAVELALRRLRVAGIPIGLGRIETGSLSGRRLLATLLVPLSDSDLKRLMRRVHRPATTTVTTTPTTTEGSTR